MTYSVIILLLHEIRVSVQKRFFQGKSKSHQLLDYGETPTW
jgi:hypothetical protein